MFCAATCSLLTGGIRRNAGGASGRRFSVKQEMAHPELETKKTALVCTREKNFRKQIAT